MRNKPCLTSDDVQRVVAAAKKHAAKLKREPTIAVVDEGGHLLYLERPDVNGVNTVEMSTARHARRRCAGDRAGRSASGCGSGLSFSPRRTISASRAGIR